MKMNQVAPFVNGAFQQSTGRENVLNQDLSNVVDAGHAFDDLTDAQFKEFVTGLVNPIGRQMFVDRVYTGVAPSMMMESWEYGALAEEIDSDLPEVETSEDWRLVHGQSYDPNVFRYDAPHAKFFSDRTTYTVKRSIIRKQLKQAFISAERLTAYLSMIENKIRNAITVANDNLKLATLANQIGECFYENDAGGDYTGEGTARCVNLLARYNTIHGTTLTAAKVLYDKDFLRYAASEIKKTAKRFVVMSTVFNAEERDRFTSPDYARLILHADFAEGVNNYLQGDTFHDQYTKLPEADIVPYWQGSGDDFEQDATTKIDVKTTEGHSVSASGILGVLFDRTACAITNYDPSVRTQYNAEGDFVNYWYEQDAGHLNNFGQNFVTFYVA